MDAVSTLLLCAPILALVSGAAGCQDEVAAQEATAEAPAARGKGGLVVTVGTLEAVLLERYGSAEDGRELLDLLVRARLLQSLAQEASVEVSSEELARRWNELDRAVRAGGDPDGLTSEIARRGLSVEEFRDFLRLSIVQERLARRALDLDPDAPINSR